MTSPASLSSGSLRRIARSALIHYNLQNAGLRLLSAKEHALFRIDTKAPSIAPQRYTLRVYDPSVFDHASVQTEIEWLSGLAHEADLLVPVPIQASGGEYIVYSTPESYATVLFGWVEGRRRKTSLSASNMEQVGRFVAQLHRFSERFQPSVGTTAQHWNWERVFGNTSIVGLKGTSPLLSNDEQRLFRLIATRVRTVMNELGQAPNTWGLIHADLHTSNYLFAGKIVGAIDFEDCGWGYYLYDLAVILDEVYAAYAPQAEVLRTALLKGYQQLRPLGHDQIRHLDIFIAMRLAELIRWYGTSSDRDHLASAKQVIHEATMFIQQRQLLPSK